jgi:alkanesulfonate monooxygenase SsuD/methylene tetrahydromethanopterin reductase-like flavin-dependent oxidoreductase (luciferase family)
VRDHVVFHPHAMEDRDRTNLESFVVLAAVGAVTRHLILATAALIPHRHPIHTANSLAALSFLFGPRILLGFGLGSGDHEFEAVGLGGVRRDALVEEQVRILRALWTGRPVTHDGGHYRFRDVDVHPSPRAPIPIWYCGNSAAAARRAAEYCDGFMPGRITIQTFVRRMRRMRRIAGQLGRPTPEAGAIPITSPARTREEAVAKSNLDGMLAEANRHRQWIAPPSGRFETLEDLEGAVIAGTPEDIAAMAQRFQAAGASHLVFDLRQRFDEWLECVQLLGEEVLPRLRRVAVT